MPGFDATGRLALGQIPHPATAATGKAGQRASLFNQYDMPQWQGRPNASATLALLTAVTFYGAHGQAPTHVNRFDHVPTPVWTGQSLDSAPLQLLTAQKFYGAGGQPPTPKWRNADATGAPVWQWTSDRNDALLVAHAAPFVVPQWSFNRAEDTAWVGRPAQSALLSPLLTAGGHPPTYRWTAMFNLDTPQPWQWGAQSILLTSSINIKALVDWRLRAVRRGRR